MKNLTGFTRERYVQFLAFSKKFFLAISILFTTLSTFSQTNTYTGSSGNWGTASNWSLGVPTNQHNVVIPNNRTVTVNTNAICKSLTLQTGNRTTNVQISGSNVLNVVETISVAPSTSNSYTKTITVNAGTLNAGSITFQSPSSANRAGGVILSSGTVNVTGDITLNNHNYFNVTGTGTLNIGGSISGGSFQSGSGTVNYEGSGVQTIYGNTASFYNLNIDKPSGTVENTGSNVFDVTNHLNVKSGRLNLSATNTNYIFNNLTIESTGTLAHHVNWDVYGTLIRLTGNLNVDGVYTYSVRSHLQMTAAAGVTRTLKTGNNPSSGLSILTFATGNFDLSGQLKVSDNLWSMFGTSGRFRTNGHVLTATAGLFISGGEFHVNGGTANISGGLHAGFSNVAGTLYVSSGTLNTDALNVLAAPTAGAVSHSGGVVNISYQLNNEATYTCIGSPVINVQGDWNVKNNGGFVQANSTVNFIGSGVSQIGGDATNKNFHNLVINKTGSNLTTTATAQTLNIYGNWTNNAQFIPASSTVRMMGSAQQAIGGSAATDFNNVVINNTNNVVLNNNINITGGSNALNFTNGKIVTGTHRVYLNAASTIAGVNDSKYVNGNLRLEIPAGASSTKVFNVGDDNYWAPVTLIFSGASGGGSVTVSTTGSEHPSILTSTMVDNLSINRYYTFTNHGVSFTNYAAVLNFNSEEIDAASNTAYYVVGQYNGFTWSYPSLGTRNPENIRATNLSNFGTFTVAENGAAVPTIATNPANFTGCPTTSTSVSAAFTTKLTGTVQWQVSTNGGGSYVNVAGGTYSTNTIQNGSDLQSTLTINPVVAGMNNYRYRAIATNNRGSVTSNHATLTLGSLPVVNAGSALTAICSEASSAPLGGSVTNATGGFWSSNVGGTFSPDANNLNAVWTPQPGFSGTAVLTLTSVGGCTPISSNKNQVVHAGTGITITPSTATICSGEVVALNVTNSENVIVNSSHAALAIPNNSSTGVTSTLAVSGIPSNAIVKNVTITFNSTHPRIADLIINIQAPNGNVLNLVERNATGTAFTNTSFSGNATTSLSSGSSPYTNTFIATAQDNIGLTTMMSNVSSFTSLYSQPNGNWILGVRDARASNSGNLNSWSIDIEWIEPTVWSPLANLFIDANALTPYTGTHATTVYFKGNTAEVANVVVSQAGVAGCNSTATAGITVNPKPEVTLSRDFCAVPGKVILTTETDIPVAGYLWNTGATTNSVIADIAIKYLVTVTTSAGCSAKDSARLGLELIDNGNFELGNTAFGSAYTYVSNTTSNGLNPEQRYTVSNNPNFMHSNFWGQDHTTGTGNMMIVNGSGSNPPINVWYKTVNVTPNTDYYFSAWAISMNSVGPFANLQFKVNGVQVGTTTGALPARAQNNNGPFEWTRFYGTWNSGAATTALVSIIDLEQSAGGNDFAIDDISFGTMSPYIELTQPGRDAQVICLGSALQEIKYEVGGERTGPSVTGLPDGVTYEFNGTSVMINGTPTTPGVYTYTLSTTGACMVVVKTGTITVQQTVGGTIAQVSLCGNASGDLVLSGHTGDVVRWERSTNNGSTWTNLLNTTTTQPYTFTGTKTMYRALVRVGSCTNEYSSVATIALHNYWTGDVNDDWNNPANWADGTLPSTGCPIVHIPVVSTVYPSIYNGVVNVHNINVHAGAVLVIDDAILNVSGTITASGNINALAGTIALSGTSAQQISGTYFVNNTLSNLVLGNTSGITVTGTDTLKISNEISFAASNVVMQVNNNLTMLSTLENTARVDDLTGGGAYSGNNILGNVTVERYIPKHSKAWQFLSVPTKGSSVKSSWMEGSNPMQNNRPGRGTMVTGHLADAVAQGFDVRTPAGATVKTYNAATNNFEGLASTLTPLQSMKGYMLLVRGDRSVMTSTAEATATTLRTTGQLYTTGADAPTAVSVNAGKFEAIGNPYASAIDFNLLTRTGGVSNMFYLWDPMLTNTGSAYGLGGYQTFTRVGSTYVVTPGGGSYAGGNTNIESGQAFMVYAPISAGTVSFTESAKVKGNNTVNRNSTLPEYFRTQLMASNNGNPILLDGVMNVFNDNSNNGVDINDAPKVMNTNENIGIRVDGKLFSVDSRMPFTTNDTVYYNISQMRAMSYQLVFVPVNSDFHEVQAYLEDSYTNSSTPISFNDTTIYHFVVTNAAASKVTNRFIMVFKPLTALPVTFTSISANPNRYNDIDVVWNVEAEINMEHYELERSVDGRTFNFLARYNPIGSGSGRATYYHTDIKPGNGEWYYRVKGVSTNGLVQYSPIARATLTTMEAGISVYPVPVENKTIMVRFSGAERSRYQVEVYNSAGAVVHRSTINNNASNQVIPIYLNNVPRGIYILRMKGATYFEKKILVN